MNIRSITDPQAWNNFVLSCSPNTFLHSWQWGQVQQSIDEQVDYLGIFSGSKQIGAALVITVNAKRGRHHLIPHGPLAQDEKTVRQILPALAAHLKNNNPGQTCALRIAPLLLSTDHNKKYLSLLGFRPAPLHVHAELTWVLDINRPAEELLSNMRKTTRHAIRRAQKNNVTTSIITDNTALNRFWHLYTKTHHRHNFTPWPRPMLEAQQQHFSVSNNIFTIIAQHNGHDVAAAILIHFGNTVYYYHGASIKLPSSIPAAQLLQWEAIQEAQRRGATQYNFWGIAPDNQPKHPFAGITTFKKGFGGEAHNFIHAHDLPLSPRYYLLWTIETARRLKRGF